MWWLHCIGESDPLRLSNRVQSIYTFYLSSSLWVNVAERLRRWIQELISCTVSVFPTHESGVSSNLTVDIFLPFYPPSTARSTLLALGIINSTYILYISKENPVHFLSESNHPSNC